jgi:transcriptional regulator with XRE-family HTH domain
MAGSAGEYQPSAMPPRKAVVSDLRFVLGQNLRIYRAAFGLSQEELAERSGIKRTYVGAIERAEVDVRLSTLKKVASGLGIEAFRLLIAADKQLAVRASA